MNPAAMAIDLDRCAGCHTCTVACQMEKGLPPEVALIPVLTVGGVQDVPQGHFPALHVDYVPRPCAHCQRPACAAACPTGALYQREDGLVLIDANLCTGCADCVAACPEGAVTLGPGGLAHKCDLCASRLDQGMEPFCILCCPTRALSLVTAHDAERAFAPAPHRGMEPALRFCSRDQERRQRVSSFLNSPLPRGVMARVPARPSP